MFAYCFIRMQLYSEQYRQFFRFNPRHDVCKAVVLRFRGAHAVAAAFFPNISKDQVSSHRSWTHGPKIFTHRP